MYKVISFLIFVIASFQSSASETSVKSIFSLPLDSFIAGPIVNAPTCTNSARCFSTLEAAPVGSRVSATDINTSRPGDYIYGRLEDVGLTPPSKEATEFYEFLSKADDRFTQFIQTPATERLTPQQKDDLARTPSEFRDLPASYRDEISNYLPTPASRRCSDPLTALAMVDNDPRFSDDSSEKRKMSLEAMLTEVFRVNCLSNDISSDFLKPTSRLVYFLDKTNTNIDAPLKCSGVAIGFDYVLTARHCMIDERAIYGVAITPELGPQPVFVVPGTRAIVLSIPHQVFTLEIQFDGFNRGRNTFDPYYDASNDLIVVRLKGLDTTLFPPVRIGEPLLLDQLFIPALYISQQNALSLVQNAHDSSELTGSFMKLIRLDQSPFCRHWKTKEGCIAHACQTEPGFSGTPIFVKKDNDYILVAVHTGSFGTRFPACGFSRGAYVPNYGVSLPMSSIKDELSRLSTLYNR